MKRYAQEIACSTSDVIGYAVLITDLDGIIIGSSQPERVGSLHEASLNVIRSGLGESVDDAEASRLKGTYPGVTYPISGFSGDVVGTMAIRGTPWDVRPFALIVKKHIEIMIREKRLLEVAQYREQSLQTVVSDMVHYVRGGHDRKNLLARAREFGYDPSRRYMPMGVDLYQFGRYAHKIRSEGPDAEVIIQSTKNRILRVIRDLFHKDRAHLVSMMGNNRYVILYALPEGLTNDLWHAEGRAVGESVLEALAQLEHKVAVGVGSASSGLEELASAYREAWNVLSLGKKFRQGPGVFPVWEYRVEELLVHIPPAERNRFVHRIVRDLKPHRDWTILRDTIIQWCDGGFSLVEASRSLHIHRNTLLYRLNKVEDILGVNVRDFRECLRLYVAFQLERFAEPPRKE